MQHLPLWGSSSMLALRLFSRLLDILFAWEMVHHSLSPCSVGFSVLLAYNITSELMSAYYYRVDVTM